MTAEIWRPILENDAYEASNLGQIRRAKPGKFTFPGKVLTPGNSRGYMRVILVMDKSLRLNRQVHRLVYEAFHGPIPDGLQINHKNGIKNDNRLENLEAVTPSENTKHSFDVLGRTPVKNPRPGIENGRAKIDDEAVKEIFRLRSLGLSQQKIADLVGLHQTNVSRILLGKGWSHVKV